MAVVVETTSALNLASRTNSTITAPTGIQNGDVLLAFLVAGDSNDQTAPTVTPPSGFNPITGSGGTISAADPYASALNIFVKVASGESGDYTFTHGAADTEGFMYRLSGVDTSTPISPNATTNTFAGGAGSLGKTVTSLGITPTVDGSLIIHAVLTWDGCASTAPTGSTPTFAERRDNNGVLYLADGVLATAGATGNKATTHNNQSNDSPWYAYLISVQASTGGGGGGTTSNVPPAIVTVRQRQNQGVRRPA